MIIPRWDLIPGATAHTIAKVMSEGQIKYPANDWLDRPYDEHVNHAYVHMIKLVVGANEDEDHLAHALTRLAMAASVRERNLAEALARVAFTAGDAQ